MSLFGSGESVGVAKLSASTSFPSLRCFHHGVILSNESNEVGEAGDKGFC